MQVAAKESHTGSVLISIGLSLLLFVALNGSTQLWDVRGPTILPAGRYSLLVIIPLLLGGLLYLKKSGEKLTVSPLAWATVMILVFLSDRLTFDYNFLQGPAIRGEIIIAGMVLYAVRRWSSQVVQVVALLAPVALIYLLLRQTGSHLIFSDDHATFLYRLEILKKTFPFVPTYNPFWNGGITATDFIPTGTLNLFLLGAPLIYLFPIESIYNVLIALVLFGVLPGCTYAAARLQNLPRPAPAAATILSIASGLIWYRWALKYGTMGFVTSASLLPLSLALTIKLLDSERSFSLRETILYIAITTLSLFWAPSALVFIPLLPLLVIALKRQSVRRVSIGLIVVLIPWAILLLSSFNVSKFLGSEQQAAHVNANQSATQAEQSDKRKFKHRAGAIDLGKSIRVLRDNAVSTNPLIVFLVIPGILLLKRRDALLYGAVLGWLAFLGAVILPLKPQLELDRMLLVAALIGCLPAGLAISQILKGLTDKHWAAPLIAALVGGMLLASPLSTAAVVTNRTVEQYHVANDDVAKMIELITSLHTPGRIVFSGCVIHELSAGHLAPLANWTNTPLVASSHVHNLWWYTSVFPEEYIARHEEGVKDYLDLFNATHVFAHEGAWIKSFGAQPERYRRIGSAGKFVLFERLNYTPTYFLEGSGEVTTQDANGIRLHLTTPDAVIKYRYHAQLRSNACKLSEEKISQSVSFIRLSECPLNSEIALSLKPTYVRVLG